MITVVNKETKEKMKCYGIWKNSLLELLDGDDGIVMLSASGHSAVGYSPDCPLDFDGDEYFIEDEDDDINGGAWWIHVSPKEGWEIM
jgi:hypothetical protein